MAQGHLIQGHLLLFAGLQLQLIFQAHAEPAQELVAIAFRQLHGAKAAAVALRHTALSGTALALLQAAQQLGLRRSAGALREGERPAGPFKSSRGHSRP